MMHELLLFFKKIVYLKSLLSTRNMLAMHLHILECNVLLQKVTNVFPSCIVEKRGYKTRGEENPNSLQCYQRWQYFCVEC